MPDDRFDATAIESGAASMKKKPCVLVMGATGQIGGTVVNLLGNDNALEIVVAARTPANAQRFGRQVVHLDLDRIETFEPALRGVDRIFMLTGYTVDMLRQSKDLINFARRAGVGYIVHLGACGDDDTRVAHYGWHQFIERYIECSGMQYTHLRPEIFMQNLLGYGGERFIKNGLVRHYIGHARVSWVDCDDVAEVAATCLRKPEHHVGKTYRLGYEIKSYGDIARLMTEKLGQPFIYEPRPPAEFLQNVLAAGAEPAYMKCVHDSYVDLSAGNDIGAEVFFDNLPSIVGHPPRTLADFIRNHADVFRY